jgi:hypothetical protein
MMDLTLNENARKGRMMSTAKFPVGTKFKTRGKAPKVGEVVDIYYTYNQMGELVKIQYVTVTETMGQPVYNYETPEATIARGLIE